MGRNHPECVLESLPPDSSLECFIGSPGKTSKLFKCNRILKISGQPFHFRGGFPSEGKQLTQITQNLNTNLFPQIIQSDQRQGMSPAYHGVYITSTSLEGGLSLWWKKVGVCAQMFEKI